MPLPHRRLEHARGPGAERHGAVACPGLGLASAAGTAAGRAAANGAANGAPAAAAAGAAGGGKPGTLHSGRGACARARTRRGDGPSGGRGGGGGGRLRCVQTAAARLAPVARSARTRTGARAHTVARLKGGGGAGPLPERIPPGHDAWVNRHGRVAALIRPARPGPVTPGRRSGPARRRAASLPGPGRHGCGPTLLAPRPLLHRGSEGTTRGI